MMTYSDYASLFAALFAAIAAGFWAASARVKVRNGFDNDKAMTEDLDKIAKLNSRGAAFAALAALSSAVVPAAKVIPCLAWLL